MEIAIEGGDEEHTNKGSEAQEYSSRDARGLWKGAWRDEEVVGLWE